MVASLLGSAAIGPVCGGLHRGAGPVHHLLIRTTPPSLVLTGLEVRIPFLSSAPLMIGSSRSELREVERLHPINSGEEETAEAIICDAPLDGKYDFSWRTFFIFDIDTRVDVNDRGTVTCSYEQSIGALQILLP